MEDKRNEVLEQCSKIKERCREIQNGEYHALIRKLAEKMNKRGEKIKEICGTGQYDLYFSGKVGIGKSTLISMLAGLYDENKLTDGNSLKDVLLLKTGSGRTTICETQIVFRAGSTRLIVEGMTQEEFDNDLKALSDYWTGRKADGTFSKKDETMYIPPQEIINCIKNMAGIPSKQGADILEFLSVKIPDGCSDMEKSRIIFEELSKRCKYEERNCTEFQFSATAGNFEEWCKNTFCAVNDGRLPSAPMPKKVILEISERDRECPVPGYIRSIVDTRGLDSDERLDIGDYISRKDSIMVMCDNIAAYGSEEIIISILKKELVPEDKDKYRRVFLLGMEKGDELEEITDEGDREEGKKRKVEEAQRVIDDKSIPFCKENYIFANTALGIKLSGKKITGVINGEIQDAGNEFWRNMHDSLRNMYSVYVSEMLSYLGMLERFSRKEISDDIMKKLGRCLENAEKLLEQLEENIGDVLNEAGNQVINFENASALRGAVNHWGKGNATNVYSIFRDAGGSEFEMKCGQLKDNIILTNKHIFNLYPPENTPSVKTEKLEEDLEGECLKFIEDQIKEMYAKNHDACRENIRSRIRERLYNSQSWQEARAFWGDGQREYRQRVWKSIDGQIKRNNLEQVLNIREYILKFMDGVISLLTIN